MLTIGDLVSLDSQAEFRNDVQLDAYDDSAKNLSLLRSYLFSGSAPDRDVAGASSISSVELLNKMIERLLHRLPNRLVAIANYGHGKSHLALALTNYFSKPVKSAELDVVLRKIESAEADQANTTRYREFKRSRGEFLVVRLRGDMPGTLREQFMRGLEQALAEHAATAGEKPRFWFAKAEELLSTLSSDRRRLADEFLEQFETDVARLQKRVERREDVYDRCIQLFTHLHGVKPDLGGEISLKQVVNWAVGSFCGDGKPLGGLVVIFDEFSLYVQKYAHSGVFGEFQDLLNGIDDHRGQSVFLAFAQHDPTTVADNMAIANQARDNLKHELTRLEKKYALQSVLESVIAAYLRQSDQAWGRFKEDKKVSGWLAQATRVTHTAFRNRYSDGLNWDLAKLDETVTKGCFPLHPLTTALLCNLRFGASTDFGVPRTVLGFVLEQWDRSRSKPAFADGRVNWVLPIQLVDYFEPRLQGGAFMAYKIAKGRLDQDAPAEHSDVLKALLLYEIAGTNLRGDDQRWFLGQCVGLDDQQTKEVLIALTKAKVIRYDPIRKVNSLWQASESPDKLEEILRAKSESAKFNVQELDRSLRTATEFPGAAFGNTPVAIPWGEPSDWAAEETLLSVDRCTAEQLKALDQPFAASPREVSSGIRGRVLWLIARDEAEMEWYRLNLSNELDRAFPGEAPPSWVLVVPSQASPELVNSYVRYQALRTFDQSEREAAGQQIYNTEIGSAKRAILEEFVRLRGEGQNCFDIPRSAEALVVPFAYRARVNAMQRQTVNSVLKECYLLAYRYAPPEYFTQYKLTQAKHRSSVRLVANLLLQNSPEALQSSILADAQARDLCEKFLRNKWYMLTPDFRVQEPEDQRARRAWEYLNETFTPANGEAFVRDTLVSLFNPPYGYDFNTATLLFCAWFGYHSHDLEVSVRGRVVNRDALARMLENGPQKFIDELCVVNPVSLTRRDPGERAKEIQAIHDRVLSGSFTSTEASEAVAILEEYVSDERQPTDARSNAGDDSAALRAAMGEANNYDRQVAQIANEIKSSDLRDLIRTLSKVTGLPRTGLVQPIGLTPAEVREQIVDRIGVVVERDCERYEKVQKLTQVDQSLEQLRDRRDILNRAGLSDLVSRVEQATQLVEQKVDELAVQEEEEKLRIEISQMDRDSRLSRLYEFRTRLQAISGQTTKTQSERLQRLSVINQEIDRLEKMAESWQPALDVVDTRDRLQQRLSELDRVTDRFAGSPLEVAHTQALTRAEQLRAFFREYGNVERDLSSSRIDTPQAVAEAQQQLVQMAERYGPSLAGGQRRVLEKTATDIQAYASRRSQEALNWLSSLEDDLRTGQPPASILQRLAKVPSFLPSDARLRLDALKTQIQDRVDDDVISSIEVQFLKITDTRKREACLERLQRVLVESQAN